MTSTTIHSTTGTASIVLSRDPRGLVRIALEDGSAQVYEPTELMTAVEAVSR